MSVSAEQRWGKDLVAELKARYAHSDTGRSRTRSTQSHSVPANSVALQSISPTPRLAADQRSPQAQDASDLAQARQMLERARWAARAYGNYDKQAVDRIVRAVAEAGAAKAQEYAEAAVQETGFGVVEHKVRKNLACSTGLLDEYGAHDYVTPRIDQAAKIVEVPRPAGVVLALTPSTNPVATTYFKVILALMTRNAVVVSPHPMAKQVCADAARTLAKAAERAGAPAGIVQVVDDPTIPLVEALMEDPRVGTIVATGGTGVVRAAYSSGNPALGVGPGNVPVFVDRTADLRAAAEAIVSSKAFDNSVLCTNESVLVIEESVADQLLREMQRSGAQLLTPAEVARLSAFMFPMGRLNTDIVGKDASFIAQAAGIKSGPATKVLLAPFDEAVPEEMMTHEKLSPVLGVIRAPDTERGIATARAIIRIAGAGHSAAIHSTDPDAIMRYTAQVPVLRVAVNVGNSTGSAGLDTNLAPSMTIGTGFIGRSSIGENLEPKHLLNWARIAYNSDDSVPMGQFSGVVPWHAPQHQVPRYPWASNDPRSHDAVAPAEQRIANVADRVSAAVRPTAAGLDGDALRAEIRRLVEAELSQIRKG